MLAMVRARWRADVIRRCVTAMGRHASLSWVPSSSLTRNQTTSGATAHRAGPGPCRPHGVRTSGQRRQGLRGR